MLTPYPLIPGPSAFAPPSFLDPDRIARLLSAPSTEDDDEDEEDLEDDEDDFDETEDEEDEEDYDE